MAGRDPNKLGLQNPNTLGVGTADVSDYRTGSQPPKGGLFDDPEFWLILASMTGVGIAALMAAPSVGELTAMVGPENMGSAASYVGGTAADVLPADVLATTSATGTVLPSTTLSLPEVGTVPGVAPSGAVSAATGGSLLSKIGSTLPDLAKATGAATTAAGNNRLTQENTGLTANAQNIQGQSAFENELMNRAQEEDRQRTNARQDAYRASAASNPSVSPFDPRPPVLSPAFKTSIANIGAQGSARLAQPAQYGTTTLPALKPYVPVNPADVQGATGTKKGVLETIGDYASPGLSILGHLFG